VIFVPSASMIIPFPGIAGQDAAHIAESCSRQAAIQVAIVLGFQSLYAPSIPGRMSRPTMVTCSVCFVIW